jgi:hypothetical protein
MLQRWELRLSVSLMLFSCAVTAAVPAGALPSPALILLGLICVVSFAVAIVAILPRRTAAGPVPAAALLRWSHPGPPLLGRREFTDSVRPRAPGISCRAPRLHAAA